MSQMQMSYNWTIIYNDQISKRSCTLSPGTAQVRFSMAPSHILPLMFPAPFNWVALFLTARAIQLPCSCGLGTQSTDVKVHFTLMNRVPWSWVIYKDGGLFSHNPGDWEVQTCQDWLWGKCSVSKMEFGVWSLSWRQNPARYTSTSKD